MVELPRSQVDRSVTQGAQSTVSGNEIRSAYGRLAAQLDQVGQTLEAAQVEQAQLEGQGAVYRDEKGQLKYDRRNPLSSVGRAFNRSAQVAFVSQVSMEARSKIVEIEAGANGNVGEFDKSSTAYLRELLKGKDKLIKGSLELEIGGLIGQTRNGMIAQQQARDIKKQESTIKAALQLADDDAANLARTGGTGTIEYAQKRDAIQSLMGELVGNPLFGMSQEEADIELRRIEGRHQAEGVIGATESIFRQKGLKAAEEFASKAFNDPNMALSPSERRAYQNHAESAIRGFKTDMALTKAEARQDAQMLTDSMAAGQQLDDEDVYEVSRRLAESGDAAGSLRLLRRHGISKQLFSFARLSDREQVKQLGRGASGLDAYVDRVIGAESSGDPNAKNPLSTATGLGQFVEGTWLDLVKRNAPEVVAGKSDAEILDLRRDPVLSRQMVQVLGQENGEALRRAGHSVTSGNLYLAHFLGAGGAIKVLNASADTDVSAVISADAIRSNPFLAGMTVRDVRRFAATKMGSDIDPGALKAMRAEVAGDAKTLWGHMKEGLKKGDPLSMEDWSLLQEQLRLAGDKDFADEVTGFLSKSGLVGFAEGTPEQMRASIAATEADGISADERDIYDAKLKLFEETEKGLKADPISMAARRGVIPPIEPIDMNNPQAFASGLGERQRVARVTGRNYGTGPVPALTASEIDNVARTLGNGSVEQSAQMLGVMAESLDDETYMATMAKVAEKTAPALAIAGGLYVRNVGVAESILRGSQLLKSNPSLLPRKKEENDAAIDEALPYVAFGPGMDEARGGFIDAARARYADLSAQSGDTSGLYSEERMNQAIRDVTGGLVEHNGQVTLPPQHGMPQEEFDRIMGDLKARDIAGAQTLGGTPITAYDIQRYGVLRAVGEGRYLIQMTGSSARGLSDASAPYAMTSQGAPFILDLTPRAFHQRDVGQ